jgi:hypothetical protein
MDDIAFVDLDGTWVRVDQVDVVAAGSGGYVSRVTLRSGVTLSVRSTPRDVLDKLHRAYLAANGREAVS